MAEVETNILDVIEHVVSAVKYHRDNKHLYGNSLESATVDAELYKVFTAMTSQYNKMVKINSRLMAIEQYNNNVKAQKNNKPHTIKVRNL